MLDKTNHRVFEARMIGLLAWVAALLAVTGKANAELYTPVHEAGVCAFRHTCKPSGSAFQPCVHNEPARPLTDQGDRQLLADLCPDLAGSPTVCCDSSQLNQLHKSLSTPQQFLSRCPACLSNFVKLWCEYTCSPDQSLFLNVTKADPFPVENGTELAAAEMTYYVSSSYAVGMYNSCANVQFPSGNGAAISLLCGSRDSCDPARLLAYLGSTDNGQAPSQIDMIIADGASRVPPPGMHSMNASITPCNVPLSNTTAACSCVDCIASCPPTPKPPSSDSESGWEIFGLPGPAVIAGLVYLALALLFLGIMFGRVRNKRRTPSQQQARITEESGEQDQEVSWCGYRLEFVFRLWGRLVVKLYWLVLIIWSVTIGGACFGITRLEVTTDPIELWSSPHSVAREQMEYFNGHFAPFYRVEQVFVKPPRHDVSYNYTNQRSGFTTTFGPALQYAVLNETLALQHAIMGVTAEDDSSGNQVTLSDICFQPLKPYNTLCSINSPLEWFQNSQANLDRQDLEPNFGFVYADFHDHLIKCAGSATLPDDGVEGLDLSCLASWGGPVQPWVVLGGYSGDKYVEATSLVLTFVVNMHQTDNHKAELWEKKFLELLESYESENVTLSYQAQRSVEDEIERESAGDAVTVSISYCLMFLYIVLALGELPPGEQPLLARVMVNAKVSLGLAGVVIVLASVAGAVGVFGLLRVPATLIIVEVVPFLVLAVGVDNMFILVQAYQRRARQDAESSVEEMVVDVFSQVAPSMLLSSTAEATAFFLGALTPMPAVRSFSLFAGMAIVLDFLSQVSCFLALLYLDARRQHAGRWDIMPWIKTAVQPASGGSEGWFSRQQERYARVLLTDYVRPVVVTAFLGWWVFCGCVVTHLDIGLDQSLSMPTDSYMLDYFSDLSSELRVGPPVYFVVESGLDYGESGNWDKVCGSAGCRADSVVSQIYHAAQDPSRTHIAQTPSSWIDDYFDWLNPSGGGDEKTCCRYDDHHNFCNASVTNMKCVSCRDQSEANQRPTEEEFFEYLDWFLNDNPTQNCSKGGHPAYKYAIDLNESSSSIGASYFMTYHTVCRTSSDFTQALEGARRVAEAISDTLGLKVFPYSVFYVFYEQYLTMARTTLINLSVCLAAIFLVCLALLSDVTGAVVTSLGVVGVVWSLIGWMWLLGGISLNAVSLVNLVMAMGIAVEFVVHIVRAWSVSQGSSHQRAYTALVLTGNSVRSGITNTKLVGIIVLAFSRSQLFQVFYFRMYLGIVVFGALHGLALLPVLLSYMNVPACRRPANIRTNAYERMTEDSEHPWINQPGTADDGEEE